MNDDRAPWPAEVDRGLVFAAWTPEGYGSAASERSLADLAHTGATDVAVVVTGYMTDRRSSEVLVHPNRTPRTEAVRFALERAGEFGLRRVLKPHVDVLGGDYRGRIAPEHPQLWFETYLDFLLPWAELAAETGCRSFWIGTELESMTSFPERWRELIAAVRQVYDGELVYAANWTDLESPATIELGRMVDVLGVDAYFPVAEEPAPSVTDMAAAWNHWILLLEQAERDTGRPVLITEIGCASRRGGPVEPWRYDGDAPIDLDLQARYYEAALRTLPGSGVVRGLFFWAWGLGEGGPDDGTHTPRGKPAAEILRQFWIEPQPVFLSYP